MPDDASTQRTLETFLRREVDAESRTVASLKALSLEMFTRIAEGTTVVELPLDGGGATRAVVNVAPQIIMAAVENVLAAVDTDNPLAGASEAHRYADFSFGRIET